MLSRNFGLEHISRIAFGTTIMMLLLVGGFSDALAYPLAPPSGGGSSSSSGGGGFEIRGEVFDLLPMPPMLLDAWELRALQAGTRITSQGSGMTSKMI
ncbi:MAG: hypothetical protein Q7J35_11190 [Candidatus Methanoperedens sp.]|nr:hypothetical protein [Candidatus Methanoperedens sp.]